MNIYFIVKILTLSLIVTACIENSSVNVDKVNNPATPPPAERDAQNKQTHSFVGNWVGNCFSHRETSDVNSPIAFYMKFELFTGRFPEDSEVEIAFYSTDDTTCSNTRAYTLKAGVNMYKVGDAPNVSEGVGEKINFTVSYIELAPNTALFTNNFNDSVECDQTNWTTNTFKDVTGLNCGQTSNVNFQIPALNQLVYYLASVKTVGDQFRAHMGWCSIGACNSEATRPIDIDLYAPFYLTKQTE